MLDEIPYEPDKPIPRLPLKARLKGVAGAALFLGATALCIWGTFHTWNDLLQPYLERGPIVRVATVTLAVPFALPIMIAFSVMALTTWTGYWLGWKRRVIDSVPAKLGKPILASFVAFLLMPSVGLFAIAPLIESKDYLYCERLSDNGRYYEMTYVKHPFLCVEEEQLPEQLALYDQLAQAQREGRLREAIIEAGMTVEDFTAHRQSSVPSS